MQLVLQKHQGILHGYVRRGRKIRRNDNRAAIRLRLPLVTAQGEREGRGRKETTTKNKTAY